MLPALELAVESRGEWDLPPIHGVDGVGRSGVMSDLGPGLAAGDGGTRFVSGPGLNTEPDPGSVLATEWPPGEVGREDGRLGFGLGGLSVSSFLFLASLLWILMDSL
jgi:hypothetical protein